jgi:hypothetical protein
MEKHINNRHSKAARRSHGSDTNKATRCRCLCEWLKTGATEYEAKPAFNIVPSGDQRSPNVT